MTRRNLMLLAAGGSFALLAGAYLFQALGYAPCTMCLWQRWPHFAAVALGVIAVFAPLTIVAVLGAFAALTTAAIGVFHAGVEWKFWDGPASCTGNALSLGTTSGKDLLDTSIAETIVMCDDIVWQFLGLSMAGWNAVFSFALAAIWIAAAIRRPG